MAQTVESACNVGDPGSIPGSRRSPGEGNGKPFQYSCMDGGACRLQSMGSQRVGQDWATSLSLFCFAHSNPGGEVLFLLWFYTWGDWSTQRSNDLPKAIQPASSQAEIWVQGSDTRVCTTCHSVKALFFVVVVCLFNCVGFSLQFLGSRAQAQ